MVKVGIVGATGYTGSELLRLLIQHPQVDIAVVTSRTETGKQVSELFPALRGYTDICYSDPATAPLAECEIVFLAAPSGTAMRQVPALLEAGVRIIDLSADFRLKDANVWRQWYGEAHCAETLLSEAVYGLPELHRGSIATARLIANPGCYPTAIILGLLPLLQAGVIHKDSIIADAKSGISGSGRKAEANLLLAENADSFRAYAVSGHRHLPEITQELNSISSDDINITFVPHILPIIRGIHATIYARLEQKTDIQEIFMQQYKDEYFVDVLPPGTHPETRSVRGSNFCRIAVHETVGTGTVVVLSVIDNLVKGAAGQAIQNMNIMLGFDEKAGLDIPGIIP